MYNYVQCDQREGHIEWFDAYWYTAGMHYGQQHYVAVLSRGDWGSMGHGVQLGHSICFNPLNVMLWSISFHYLLSSKGMYRWLSFEHGGKLHHWNPTTTKIPPVCQAHHCGAFYGNPTTWLYFDTVTVLVIVWLLTTFLTEDRIRGLRTDVIICEADR